MEKTSPNVQDRLTPLLGAHFSIADGLDQALVAAEHYHCNALQIFTKNASSWKERKLTPEEIDLFHATWKKTGVRIVAAHTSYLINLASPEKKKSAMSRHALKEELIRASQLGLQYVVLHPGSHMGTGEEEGLVRISDGINDIFASLSSLNTRLLLETTAGQGSNLGYTFEQLASLAAQIENKAAIGVCLDTSHIFAAGYDIRAEAAYQQTMTRFDDIIGIEKLCLIHLNDSQKGLGSRVDRHAHIGVGEIGLAAFGYIMNDPRLWEVPKIIETPKKDAVEDWDHVNLNKLKGLVKAAD